MLFRSLLVAAPLAFHIPLAALAGILIFVGWNMGDWRAFARLWLFALPYRVTLLSVFLLTVIFDLTVAVEVGLVVACLTLIYRVSSLSRSEAVTPAQCDALREHSQSVQAWRLHGALFFGAVRLIEDIERQQRKPALVMDLKHLIYLDSSGQEAIEALIQSCQRQHIQVVLCGLSHQPLDIAQRTGLLQRYPVRQAAHLQEGIEMAIALCAKSGDDSGHRP